MIIVVVRNFFFKEKTIFIKIAIVSTICIIFCLLHILFYNLNNVPFLLLGAIFLGFPIIFLWDFFRWLKYLNLRSDISDEMLLKKFNEFDKKNNDYKSILYIFERNLSPKYRYEIHSHGNHGILTVNDDGLNFYFFRKLVNFEPINAISFVDYQNIKEITCGSILNNDFNINITVEFEDMERTVRLKIFKELKKLKGQEENLNKLFDVLEEKNLLEKPTLEKDLEWGLKI